MKQFHLSAKSGLMLAIVALLLTPLQVSAGKPKTAEEKINKAITTALSYVGTKHKMGGLSRRGIDCSGLMVKSFEAAGYSLPRVSRDQAHVGLKVKMKDLKKGDLVFFKQGSKVDHVGLVVAVSKDQVRFVHTSSSKGVMVSKLEERYWNKHYHSARRIWEADGKKKIKKKAKKRRKKDQDKVVPTKQKLKKRDVPATPDEEITSRPATTGPAPTPNVHQRPALESKPRAVPAVGKYPHTSSRPVNPAELREMSARDLAIMKYEILARHGYWFESWKTRKYFLNQDWYTDMDKIKDKTALMQELSKVERENLKLIQRVEKSKR
ncbi:MAG: NlpC/P60 family protein [Bacteroidota bacterium]